MTGSKAPRDTSGAAQALAAAKKVSKTPFPNKKGGEFNSPPCKAIGFKSVLLLDRFPETGEAHECGAQHGHRRATIRYARPGRHVRRSSVPRR
jgi:hypothetical protein